MTADQRRLVLALIAAVRGAKETGSEISSPEPVTTEGHGNDRLSI